MLWVQPCIETTVAICYGKSSIYFGYLLCHICRLLYAKYYMSVSICRIPCASYCKFILISVYVPISVPNAMCLVWLLYVECYMPYALRQISHASYSMPIFICRHMSAKCFLRVAKLAYMSISVAISQTTISQFICQVLYFICYMPNAICYMPNSVC
jgi:hypothetical protein